jgi:hypothetical protein
MVRAKAPSQVWPQSTGSTCWLACFRTMLHWKGRDPYSVESTLASAGIDVDTALHDGLLPKDNLKAAKALGMHARGVGQSLTLYDFTSLLPQSPLWCNGVWYGTTKHVMIVVGADEDTIEFFDPWYDSNPSEALDVHRFPFSYFVHGNRKQTRGTDALMGYYQLLYW